MTDLIRGDLCVLRDNSTDTWIVCICLGPGKRDFLKRFRTREDAATFAFAERERRRDYEGLERNVQFPDDCPCYATGGRHATTRR